MILGIYVSFPKPEKGCTFSRNSSTAVRDVFGCIAVMLLLLALPLLIHFISMKTLLCAQGTSTHLSIMFIQVLYFTF
jgi:hypothetical protein